MVFKELKATIEMHKFELHKPIGGKVIEITPNVGVNKSTVYTVGKVKFWGTKQLDQVMQLNNVKVGDVIRVTLIDDNYQYENGLGRFFKVERDE